MLSYEKQLVTILLFAPMSVMAGSYFCGGNTVPETTRACPDGSIPVYKSVPIQPVQPAQPAAPQNRPIQPTPPITPQPAPTPKPPPTPNLSIYFGVWHTNVPGAVWTSSSTTAGYDRLHVSAGAVAGNLVIKPNGTYTWASYGGKSGKWVNGDSEYPIVLIDTVENRQWKVGLDSKHPDGQHIYIWDGNAYYYSGKR